MQFSSAALERAEEALNRAKEKMARIKEHAEEAIGNGIQVAEVSGAAFVFGYANGHWGENGEISILGVPADLGVGIALTGVAMFGGFGKYAEHGVNIGAGALAAYAYRSGFQLGADSAAEDDASDGASPQMGARRTAAARMNRAPARTAAFTADGRTFTVHENH